MSTNIHKILSIVFVSIFMLGCGSGGDDAISSSNSDSNQNVGQTTEQNRPQNVTLPDLSITDDVEGVLGVTLVDQAWIAGSVTFTFAFDEAVSQFDSSYIEVDGATKGAFSGSADRYYLTVTPPTHSTTPITVSVLTNSTTNNSTQATQAVNTVKPFVTLWDTTQDGNSSINQIKITTNPNYNYNYNIRWGDGSIDLGVEGNITHTYAQEGNYSVEIDGTYPAPYFADWIWDDAQPNHYDNEKLITIVQWGTQHWKSMNSAFHGTHNMQGEFEDKPDLALVDNMYGMFAGARVFNYDMSRWDVSNVENMSSLFCCANEFNQSIADWDVSKVIHMGSMFREASDFNQSLLDWDVSQVTNMSGMFAGATHFNRDITRWDVRKVTHMDGMFFRTQDFNQSIGVWDTASLRNTSSMFCCAESFNQDINNWDTSNVIDMNRMFKNSFVFNQDISQWDTSNVIDLSGMFYEAKAFNQDISQWDLTQAEDFSRMFQNNTVFNQNISQWSTVSAINMEKMFKDA
ncbi:MAG: BspA family leucine-rich repeat surface protein, partial [Campylobacterota bacterium]|nr:BspA family leucine-rich repeat surface protein [Campylobacterota bacterium]